MSDHHPPHIYVDKTWYIISASTRNRQYFLASDQAKSFVREALRSLAASFAVRLRAWVILDNHYHLLLETNQGQVLPKFIARLHRRTSFEINRLDSVIGRKVWHNYWDTSIRTEHDMWTRFNYIHHNPVKHGYVKRLEDWPFSSYGYYLKTMGNDWVQDCWGRYPVVDSLEGDDFSHRGSSTSQSFKSRNRNNPPGFEALAGGRARQNPQPKLQVLIPVHSGRTYSKRSQNYEETYAQSPTPHLLRTLFHLHREEPEGRGV